ncbi:hypothetical protein [Kitasatospora sp. NPDC057015]|uniref:hypothetical protein n=1 Tax=Kitasatospora sp. NPDC057015 TaxID=3346001 RepID=UPI0036422360
MPDTTALDNVDAMIEKAWGLPMAELEKATVRRSVEDPLLDAAMQTRRHLVVVCNAVAVHQARLHALSRPGHTPAFYDLDRITDTASALRTAYAESNTALQAIRHVISAREAPSRARSSRRSGPGCHGPPRSDSPPVGPAHCPSRTVGGSESRIVGGGESTVAATQSAAWSPQMPGSVAPTVRANSSKVSSTR